MVEDGFGSNTATSTRFLEASGVSGDHQFPDTAAAAADWSVSADERIRRRRIETYAGLAPLPQRRRTAAKQTGAAKCRIEEPSKPQVQL